jgi:hypothetical protein
MPKCGTSSLLGQHQRAQGPGWWGVLRHPAYWYRSFYGHLLMHGGWPCVAQYTTARDYRGLVDGLRFPTAWPDRDHLWNPGGGRLVPGGLWSQHVAWWWQDDHDAWTVERLIGMEDLPTIAPRHEHRGPVEALPLLTDAECEASDGYMMGRVRAQFPEAVLRWRA